MWAFCLLTLMSDLQRDGHLSHEDIAALILGELESE